MKSKATSSGLDGVIVAETMISDVDGERGRLVIAGSDVEQLAAEAALRSRRVACARSGSARPIAASGLAAARVAAWEMPAAARRRVEATDGDGRLRAASRICARAVTIVATRSPRSCARRSSSPRGAGGAVVSRRSRPMPSLDHAADYLRMTIGEVPTPTAAARSSISRHGDRSWHERVDVHRARRHLDRIGSDLGDRRRRSARSRGRCTAARPGRCSTCSTRSATPANAEAVAARRARRRPAASWAWATASTACAIRVRRCSRLRSSRWRRPRLELARAVELAAAEDPARAEARSSARRERRVLHRRVARRRRTAARAVLADVRASAASPAGARTWSSSARSAIDPARVDVRRPMPG